MTNSNAVVTVASFRVSSMGCHNSGLSIFISILEFLSPHNRSFYLWLGRVLIAKTLKTLSPQDYLCLFLRARHLVLWGYKNQQAPPSVTPYYLPLFDP